MAKICYLEIPSTDINISAAFYREVFGWKIRDRGDGQIAFDDSVEEVSGTWITGRTPSKEPGVVISIMVDDIYKAMQLVITHGGKIVQPVGMDAPELTARFSDPSGNIFALYQQPA
jgi:predicted enzyme related to lactoylglutathione lyase